MNAPYDGGKPPGKSTGEMGCGKTLGIACASTLFYREAQHPLHGTAEDEAAFLHGRQLGRSDGGGRSK